MRFEKGKSLKSLTTLGIGGKAGFFVEVKKEEDLKEVFNDMEGDNWYVIGSGSNIVASDSGFSGIIIRNCISNFKTNGRKVYVGAGNVLLDFIFKIEKLGFAGMEKMAGIPGTVAGAIYGNAGAYGQEIHENLLRVRIFDTKLKKFRWLTKKECGFAYRTSNFKKNKNWIIVGAEFSLKKGDPKKLVQISKETIKLREKKYPPGLLCPGSFFKNIVIAEMKPKTRKDLLSKIDNTKIVYGKLPSGYLLEEVGAKGMSSGKIQVADYHANLFFNSGGGTAQDIRKLAVILKDRVLKKFGIKLEEEVQYLG